MIESILIIIRDTLIVSYIDGIADEITKREKMAFIIGCIVMYLILEVRV